MTQDEIFTEFTSRFHSGDGHQPVDPDRFLALETELGVLLPQAFRSFTQRFGPISTPGLLILVANEDSEDEGFDLQRIAGADELAPLSEQAWESGMPRDLVAFARDSLGNPYCFLGLAAEGHRPPDAPVALYELDFGLARRVADSFTSLLEGFLRFR